MHVLCYGAGAVGSLIGGRLSLGGVAEVTLLARRGHVAAIRTWGLRVETPDGAEVCKGVDSITSLDDLRVPPDVVVLTVKAYHTEEALGDLAPLVRGGARILTLQNGIGNEEAIAAVVGVSQVVSGAVTLSVSAPRPGVVRQHTTTGGIALAAIDGVVPPSDLVEALRRAGFRAEGYSDYRAMKWSKLLLNILGNATSAILDLPPGEVARDPRAFTLEREAFREAVRVVTAIGLRPVPLPGYPIPLLARVMAGPAWLARLVVGPRLGGGRGGKMPSLWEDLDRGRAQSEVAVLNGAVVREGQRLGIPTPVNALLTDVLLALSTGRRDRGEFRRRPEALFVLRRSGASA